MTQSRYISDLGMIAKIYAMARGSATQSAAVAESIRASANVIAVIRAAVGATTAADYAPYSNMVATFLETLRSSSVFVRLLSDGMTRTPLLTPVRSLAVAVTGTVISEGHPAPVSKVTLQSPALPKRTAVALLALTKEAVGSSAHAALAFLESELRKAVAAAADGAFIAIAGVGISPRRLATSMRVFKPWSACLGRCCGRCPMSCPQWPQLRTMRRAPCRRLDRRPIPRARLWLMRQ